MFPSPFSSYKDLHASPRHRAPDSRPPPPALPLIPADAAQKKDAKAKLLARAKIVVVEKTATVVTMAYRRGTDGVTFSLTC